MDLFRLRLLSECMANLQWMWVLQWGQYLGFSHHFIIVHSFWFELNISNCISITMVLCTSSPFPHVKLVTLKQNFACKMRDIPYRQSFIYPTTNTVYFNININEGISTLYVWLCRHNFINFPLLSLWMSICFLRNRRD